MKLEDYKQTYEQLSGKASEIARYLGIAGIAIIWLFSQGTVGQPAIPIELRWPALLLVAGLTADLLQYTIGTLLYFAYFRYKERDPKISEDTSFRGPVGFTAPGWFLWGAKIILIGTAYVHLLMFLRRELV